MEPHHCPTARRHPGTGGSALSRYWITLTALLMLIGAGLAVYAGHNGLHPLTPQCASALGALTAANLLAAPLLYGWDKWLAIAGRDQRRIPELALHMVSLGGGAIGAFISCQLFRHKVRKRSFQRGFWLTLPVSLALYYGASQLCG